MYTNLVVVNSTSGRGLSLRAVGNSSAGSWRSTITQSFKAGEEVVIIDQTTFKAMQDRVKETLRQSDGEKRQLKDLDKRSKVRRRGVIKAAAKRAKTKRKVAR